MLDDGLIPQGASGNPQRLLLILQGMDTCGKDGVIKHVLGGLNPVGVRVASFDKPTRRELAHHFLWGIKRQVPGPGLIGVFNRSHYEDVLVPRVHEMVPTTVLAQRYAEINSLEQHLANHRRDLDLRYSRRRDCCRTRPGKADPGLISTAGAAEPLGGGGGYGRRHQRQRAA